MEHARSQHSWQHQLLPILMLISLVLVSSLALTRSTVQAASSSCTATPIQAIRASGDDGNIPANVLDGDLSSRWSSQPLPAWALADLGSVQPMCGVSIAWYKGDGRIITFAVQLSTNGERYQQVYVGTSSGTTSSIETATFAPSSARYVRIVVTGNSHNNWASITELRILSRSGSGSPTTTPRPTTPTPSPGPGTRRQPRLCLRALLARGLDSREEVARLPMSGPAWEQHKHTADGDLGKPNIADQDSNHDVNTLAVALLYARTGDGKYRTTAAEAILRGNWNGEGRAHARNLLSYVIAADLIDSRSYDAAKDQLFRSWLRSVRTERLDGKTLIETHEERPNNWGTMPGASRIAADLYLGDKADLDKAAQVFKGWLGDR